MNDLGVIARSCWMEIPKHYQNVNLGAFIVMPNHFHGIIEIIDDPPGRGTIYRAPTDELDNHERFGKPIAGSIPTIIRTFKAAVTRIAGQDLQLFNIWQRNYFEHIITSDDEYATIDAYISSNPANWLADAEFCE